MTGYHPCSAVTVHWASATSNLGVWILNTDARGRGSLTHLPLAAMELICLSLRWNGHSLRRSKTGDRHESGSMGAHWPLDSAPCTQSQGTVELMLRLKEREAAAIVEAADWRARSVVLG